MRAILAALLFLSITATAQNTTTDSIKPKENKPEKKWFESISVRGYMQLRYNRLLETNNDLGCEQCDKSWGGNGGFFIRRMRIIFFGQLSKQVYFYVQPDFASAASTDKQHFAQLRDAYIDVGLDSKNEFRFRIGQSKVPYGFENMQSSQNRLPLDRADATNSGVANERDLGIFFYWAPSHIRTLYSELVRSGLKGSGDYGVIGVGAYNGQTANQYDLNNDNHVAARISYPVKIKNQIIEGSVQAYNGKFILPKSNLSSGVKYKSDLSYTDQRAAVSFVLYPKPFGVLAEYNMGKGPEYNSVTDSIETKDLTGGFITLCYMTRIKSHVITPFVRMQYYSGGKKHERDARSYSVNDSELGIEWQASKNFELTAMYTISNRRYEDHLLPSNKQDGSLLRLQAQLNF
ncbi:MAG: porin [Bacteroidia bacterium]|nr:porin [Bacteroidia bacterium]